MSTDPAFPTTAGWRPHPRYPDPAITALDPRFEQYWLKLRRGAPVHRVPLVEGPVWFGDGRYLLWSDIPNNRVLKWEEATGTVSVFSSRPTLPMATPVTGTAGLITCEHGGRRVTRTEYDGTLTVLMDTWQGHRLNSPMTWWSNPTAPSGLLIRSSAFWGIMKAIRPP